MSGGKQTRQVGRVATGKERCKTGPLRQRIAGDDGHTVQLCYPCKSHDLQ